MLWGNLIKDENALVVVLVSVFKPTVKFWLAKMLPFLHKQKLCLYYSTLPPTHWYSFFFLGSGGEENWQRHCFLWFLRISMLCIFFLKHSFNLIILIAKWCHQIQKYSLLVSNGRLEGSYGQELYPRCLSGIPAPHLVDALYQSLIYQASKIRISHFILLLTCAKSYTC